jgi:phosphohistidine swiveling domain-containing protein
MEEKKVILQGRGASRGIVEGCVRIVINPEDLERIEANDIIIAPMTNPSMVVAMSKAAAIVTDSGGITCHAAIISRELGKPCVVGTQNATSSLKNGMTIEVDGTNGLVMLLENKMDTIKEAIPSQKAFKIFGNLCQPVRLRVNRDKPIRPENWQDWEEDWSEVRIGEEWDWISPRPEIVEIPLLISLHIQAMEKVPHNFGFNIGPLYTRLNRCEMYWRLDKTQQFFALLADKLLSRDEQFIEWFKKRLYELYDDLDRASENLKFYNFSETPLDRLLDLFKDWWRVHEDFFSHCLFIQSMGDDIVWPRISEILLESYPEDKVNELMGILSLPTEKVLSTNFYDELMELVEVTSQDIKALIFSNLAGEEIIRIIKRFPEGELWLNKDLNDFIQEWGWMRDRDFYFEPINTEAAVLEFIKKNVSQEISHTSLEKNAAEVKRCLEEIERVVGKDEVDELVFFLNLGKFLQRERDNHHVMWVRNSHIIRELFLEMARRFMQSGWLETEKDIFFLFAPEIYKLAAPDVLLDEKREIADKIPRRMSALTFVSKLKLHERKGYDTAKAPEPDGEYY